MSMRDVLARNAQVAGGGGVARVWRRPGHQLWDETGAEVGPSVVIGRVDGWTFWSVDVVAFLACKH